MKQLHDLKAGRKEMMKKTDWTVELKRSRKEKKYLNCDLDNAWLTYLNEHKAGWLKHPQTFFFPDISNVQNLRSADPFVGLVGVYHHADCLGH